MREKLTVADSFEVLKMLEKNGTADNGIYTYRPGWDDERIAKELNVSVSAVAYRRKEAFGDLRRGGAHENTKRIDTLEVGATALRLEIHELKKRMSAMEKALNILLQGKSRDEVEKTVGKDKLDELKQHFSGRVIT